MESSFSRPEGVIRRYRFRELKTIAGRKEIHAVLQASRIGFRPELFSFPRCYENHGLECKISPYLNLLQISFFRSVSVITSASRFACKWVLLWGKARLQLDSLFRVSGQIGLCSGERLLITGAFFYGIKFCVFHVFCRGVYSSAFVSWKREGASDISHGSHPDYALACNGVNHAGVLLFRTSWIAR